MLDPYYKACADCYLVSTIPGAADHLERFKESVNEALDMLRELRDTLPLIEQELTSLSNMQLLEPEPETDEAK